MPFEPGSGASNYVPNCAQANLWAMMPEPIAYCKDDFTCE